MAHELTVAVVEELPALRRGLAALLAEQGIDVVEPTDPAVWAAEHPRPVVLIGARSLEQLRALTLLVASQPGLAVVAVVAEVTEVTARTALVAGASGVISHDAEGAELADALRLAARNVCNLAVPMVRGWAASGEPLEPPVALGRDDLEIMRRLAEGKTVVQIAHDLSFAERSLHRRLAELYKRMGVENRQQAIAAATRWALLHETPRP